MQSETFTKLRLIYTVAAIATTLLALGFIRINLVRTGIEAMAQFANSNRNELANADTMKLATKLNALLASENIECISGKYGDKEFISYAKGSCSSSVLVSESVYRPPGVEDLEIHMSFIIPDYLIYSALSFILGQIILFSFLHRVNRQKILVDEQIKDLVFNVSKQVAHDIRSPLSALNLVLSVVKNEISPDKHSLLEHSVTRINDIAKNLLSSKSIDQISKIKDSEDENLIKTFEIDATVFSLNSAVEQIVAEKNFSFAGGNVKITPRLTETKICKIKFNEPQLKRILSNLINNAVEAMSLDRTSEILISSMVSNKYAILQISDNGKGMSAEVLSQIGESGFSQGKEHVDTAGYGLGVAHAKSTVKKLGGEFFIRSQAGVGTTITLNLPIV